jgi:hypothetical protein
MGATLKHVGVLYRAYPSGFFTALIQMLTHWRNPARAAKKAASRR